MLLTLLPGADRDRLLNDVNQLRNELTNLAGLRAHPPEMLTAYIRWTLTAENTLRLQVQATDVDRLVLPKSQEMLVMTQGAGRSDAFNHVYHAEVQRRLETFNTAHDALRVEITRWKDTAGWLVVADTNVYLRAPDKLRDPDGIKHLNFHELLNSANNGHHFDESMWLHILVPIVIVDELDKLKQHHDKHVRWRAMLTLAVFDDVFANPARPGQLREGLTMELVLDPPRHVRLPRADDEIIARTQAVHGTAGRPVTVLTYDTGMATRARIAKLHTAKLTQPQEGPEPEPKGTGTKSSRDRRRDGASAAPDQVAPIPDN